MHSAPIMLLTFKRFSKPSNTILLITGEIFMIPRSDFLQYSLNKRCLMGITSLLSSFPFISQKHMDMSSDNSRRSETLAKAAQTLRLYKPHLNFNLPDGNIRNKDSIVGDSAEELIFQRARQRSLQTNRAAVLICLFEGENGEIRVILTKRSSSMASHSGEVALPGGKWEEGDANDAETALREAKEEIGLQPSAVEVVTFLEPLYTKRDITVIPVVGILWDKNAFNPVPNANEVESVFDAPLEMFLKNENRREVMQELMGYEFLVHLFDYQTENRTYIIWALTAAILIKTASVVFQQPPAFEERRPQFWGRSRH